MVGKISDYGFPDTPSLAAWHNITYKRIGWFNRFLYNLLKKRLKKWGSEFHIWALVEAEE